MINDVYYCVQERDAENEIPNTSRVVEKEVLALSGVRGSTPPPQFMSTHNRRSFLVF